MSGKGKGKGKGDKSDEKTAQEKAVEQWRIKKLIQTLQEARGNGTSMISLIVPPNDQISKVSKRLLLYMVKKPKQTPSLRSLATPIQALRYLSPLVERALNFLQKSFLHKSGFILNTKNI